MMFALLMALVQVVPEEERLIAPMPTGFYSAFNAEQGPVRIEERVPKGESVQRWTRMITVQRFAGGARVGPQRLLDGLAAGFAQSCAGSVAEPVTTDAVSASIRIDCPLNPQTGKPETMFARAFGGDADLHVVQYAFRAKPAAVQVTEARAYLASVSLCGGARGGCPAAN